MTTSDSPKNPPVDKVRMGTITASIWENPTKHGVMHTVTLENRYFDGTDWKPAKNFSRDDLPVAAKVLDLTHTKIYELAAASRQRS